MSTLPRTAHGDTLPVVKIGPKNEGKGEARHFVGTQFNGLLLFDNCAQATIIVPGLDPAKMPAPDVITERNMKMDFLKVRFTDLTINYFGTEYGGVRYSGTASSAEIVKPEK